VTDPPVTVSGRARRSTPFCFYIEGWPSPEIVRFAIALGGSKRLYALSA